MDKAQLVAALEQYWYDEQRKNPEELMDISTAIGFYNAQTYEYVLQEYKALIG